MIEISWDRTPGGWPTAHRHPVVLDRCKLMAKPPGYIQTIYGKGDKANISPLQDRLCTRRNRTILPCPPVKITSARKPTVSTAGPDSRTTDSARPSNYSVGASDC